MTLAALIKEKKANSLALVNKYDLPKGNKALGFVKIADKKILKKLLKGLSGLSTNFIVLSDDDFNVSSNNIVFQKNNSELDSGADFLICDDAMDCIVGCLEKGITPITISGNTLLSQFDPMKSQGNSYLCDNADEWSIFATLIRYLENYKFTFDNKNLVKNIFES